MIHRIFKLALMQTYMTAVELHLVLLIFRRCMLTCKYTYIKVPLCPKLYFLGVFKKKKKAEFKDHTVGTVLKEFGFTVNMMVNPFMPCFVWRH